MDSIPKPQQQANNVLLTPPGVPLPSFEAMDFSAGLQVDENWFDIDPMGLMNSQGHMMWTEEEYEPQISIEESQSVKGQSELVLNDTKESVVDVEHAKKKRQQQNRMAQRSFRQRKQEAFEDVTKQLKSERRTSAALREEISRLQAEIRSLREERSRSLEAAVRIRAEFVELEKALGGWSPVVGEPGPSKYGLT